MADYNCSHIGMQAWGDLPEAELYVTTYILYVLDRGHHPKHF